MTQEVQESNPYIEVDAIDWQEWSAEEENQFQKTIFGVCFDPSELDSQPAIEGHVTCERTGVFCEVFDASVYLEGVGAGLLQIHFLGTETVICGYKGKDIRSLLKQRMTPEHLSVALMAETYRVFSPLLSVIRSSTELLRAKHGILTEEHDSTILPLAISFGNAKRVSYVLRQIWEQLERIGLSSHHGLISPQKIDEIAEDAPMDQRKNRKDRRKQKTIES